MRDRGPVAGSLGEGPSRTIECDAVDRGAVGPLSIPVVEAVGSPVNEEVGSTEVIG